MNQQSAKFSKDGWYWRARLNYDSGYWHISGWHRDSGIRWAMLVPTIHLARRGIGIDQYLAEQPSVHRAYVDCVERFASRPVKA